MKNPATSPLRYGESRFDIGDVIRMLGGMLFMALASGLIRKGIAGMTMTMTFSGILMGMLAIVLGVAILPLALFLIFGWLLKRRPRKDQEQSDSAHCDPPKPE